MSVLKAYKHVIESIANDLESNIVAYVGVIGSGKDYMANSLVEDGYTKLAFADPVRQLVARQLDIDPEDMGLYNEIKTTNWVLERHTYTNLPPEEGPFAEIQGRRLYVALAEGAKQLFGEEAWVKVFMDNIIKLRARGFKNIVVSDARFWYELELLDKLRAKIYFTNFISFRYQLNDLASASNSELFATWLVEAKYVDGQRVIGKTIQEFKAFYGNQLVDPISV